LARLSESLGEQGIRLLVLRNYEGFPDSNNSRDLDLLISRSELPLAIRALRSIGGIRIVGYAERYYVASVLVAGVSMAREARAIQLDFYLTMSWKGIPYLRMETLMQAAIQRRAGSLNFYVPHPVHEAILSLFAGLLLGGRLKERYFPQAQRTFAAGRSEAVDALRPQFGVKVAARLVDSIIEGDRSGANACAGPMRAALALRGLRSPFRNSLNILRHYGREYAARFTRQDLETVCIAGPHACCKSTIVERLLPILQFSSVLVEKRDSGPGLPPVQQSPGIRLHEGTYTNHRGKGSATPVKVLRWLIEEWLDQFFGKSLPTLRICESSYYDLLADPSGFSWSGPKWFPRLAGKLLPAADLWILLDQPADGSLSSGQKPQLAQPGETDAAYIAFVKTRKKYVILNASKPVATVTEDAYAAIIDTLAERADRQLKSRFK
jgi:hypothetical protein